MNGRFNLAPLTPLAGKDGTFPFNTNTRDLGPSERQDVG